LIKDIPTLQLALFILYEEQNPNSFWKAYIESMPATAVDLPMFWSLKNLKFAQSMLQLVSYVKQYTIVYNLLLQFPKCGITREYFTWSSFKWAYSLVMSRQNRLKSTNMGQNKQVLAMVPLFDMINHGCDQLSSDYDDEADTVIIKAGRDFKEGEEFVMFYGPRTNSDFLLNQGFCPKGNKHNAIELTLSFNPRDKLIKEKSALTTKYWNIKDTVDTRVLLRDGKIVAPLAIAFLRIWAVREASEMPEVEKMMNVKTYPYSSAISVENELKAYMALIINCRIQLKAYEGVSTGDGSIGRSVLAGVFVEETKSLLNSIIEACQAYTKALKENPALLEQVTEALNDVKVEEKPEEKK